jgi:putative cardiolipin synthase
VVRSPEIAHQVVSLIDDLSADGSYRLSLDAAGHIVWSSGEGSDKEVWHNEPETTAWQRLAIKLLAPFAPEELL